MHLLVSLAMCTQVWITQILLIFLSMAFGPSIRVISRKIQPDFQILEYVSYFHSILKDQQAIDNSQSKV